MVSKEKVVDTKVRGIEMKLLASNRSLELCARMNYETENLDFIDQVPKGAVFYDLGACEGRFSIYAALRGLQVYAFEPESMNFNALKKNIKLNEIDGEDLVIINAGVSDRNQIGDIRIGQPWAGGHQKVVNHQGYARQDLQFEFSDRQQIELVELDDFIKQNGLPQPDFLKVDIDGSEEPFIEGAEKTLRSEVLKSMIFELSKKDKNFNHIIDSLGQYGLLKHLEYPIPNEYDLYNIVFNRI